MEWKDWFSLNSVVRRIEEKRWVVKKKYLIADNFDSKKFMVEITNIWNMITLLKG